MSKSPKAFALAINKWGKETPEKASRKVLTVLALDGMRSLTQLTPVDTGRLKGNWQFTVGQPADGEIDRVDKSPDGTPGSAGESEVLQRMPEWRMGQFIWFHNGLPYARYVNDGTEKVPARMMVEQTAERLQRLVRGLR